MGSTYPETTQGALPAGDVRNLHVLPNFFEGSTEHSPRRKRGRSSIAFGIGFEDDICLTFSIVNETPTGFLQKFIDFYAGLSFF